MLWLLSVSMSPGVIIATMHLPLCHRSCCCQSLLRSPKAPDAECDMGVHHFRYGLLPHVGAFPCPDVVNEAIAFNTPLIISPLTADASLSSSLVRPLFSVQPESPTCMPVRRHLCFFENCATGRSQRRVPSH
jgi:hypothetical protein